MLYIVSYYYTFLFMNILKKMLHSGSSEPVFMRALMVLGSNIYKFTNEQFLVHYRNKCICYIQKSVNVLVFYVEMVWWFMYHILWQILVSLSYFQLLCFGFWTCSVYGGWSIHLDIPLHLFSVAILLSVFRVLFIYNSRPIMDLGVLLHLLRCK